MLPADPDRGGITEHAAPRIATGNLHGTGCTLSAAIAVLLPLLPLVKVVEEAELYLTEALKASGRLTVGAAAAPSIIFTPCGARNYRQAVADKVDHYEEWLPPSAVSRSAQHGAGKFRPRADAQLVVDGLGLVADGGRCAAQHLRRLLVGCPAGEQVRHFALARREPVELG